MRYTGVKGRAVGGATWFVHILELGETHSGRTGFRRFKTGSGSAPLQVDKSSDTHPPRRSDIWVCSVGTIQGGRCKSVSQPAGEPSAGVADQNGSLKP
jgi:hypothetical protein